MADSAVQILIEAVDQASAPLRNILQMSENLLQSGESLQRMGRGMTEFIARPFQAAITEAIGFESAMADVTKVLGDDMPADFDQTLLTMSREIPIAAEGLAAIAASGGQLGVAAGDIAEFTEITAQMSTAFDMNADQAGQSIAKLMTVMNLNTMDEVRQVGDLFNHLSDNSGATAAALVDVATRTGGIARTFGLANNEAAALSASFIEMAPSPEIAATAINSLLPALQTATGQTPAFREALESIGISAGDMVAMIESDAMGGLTTFLDSLGALDSTARANVIRDMFGTGSDAALINTLAGDTSILADNLLTVADASDFGGSMMREFENRSATTANQIQLLRNNLSEVAITVGGALLPAVNSIVEGLKPLITGFADFAAANPKITAIGVAIAGVVAAIGPLVWIVGSIISAAGAIATFVTGFSALFAMGGALAALGPPLVMAAGAIGAIVSALAGAATLAVGLLAIPFAIFQIGAAAQGTSFTIQEFFGVIRSSLAAIPANLAAIPAAFGGAFMAAVNIGRMHLAQFVAAIQQGAAQMVAAIQAAGQAMIASITGLAGAFFSAGANIISSLVQGIRSQIGAAQAAIASVASTIRGALPFSPPKWGPLSDIMSAGGNIVSAIASGINSTPITSAMSGALSPAANQLSMPSGNGGGATSINFAPVINAGAGTDVNDIRAMLNEAMQDFMAEFERHKARVSYG